MTHKRELTFDDRVKLILTDFNSTSSPSTFPFIWVQMPMWGQKMPIPSVVRQSCYGRELSWLLLKLSLCRSVTKWCLHSFHSKYEYPPQAFRNSRFHLWFPKLLALRKFFANHPLYSWKWPTSVKSQSGSELASLYQMPIWLRRKLPL